MEFDVPTSSREVDVLTASGEVNVFTASREVDIFTASKEGNVFTASREVDIFTASKESNVFTASREGNAFTVSREDILFTALEDGVGEPAKTGRARPRSAGCDQGWTSVSSTTGRFQKTASGTQVPSVAPTGPEAARDVAEASRSAAGDAATSVSGEALRALQGQAGASGPEVLEDVEMADVSPGGQEPANELELPAGQVGGTEPERLAEQGFSSGQGEAGAEEAQGQDDVGGEWTEVERKGRKVRGGGKAQPQ
jgi:hypothetical protein